MVTCPFLHEMEQKLIFFLNIPQNQCNYYSYQYSNCRARSYVWNPQPMVEEGRLPARELLTQPGCW